MEITNSRKISNFLELVQQLKKMAENLFGEQSISGESLLERRNDFRTIASLTSSFVKRAENGCAQWKTAVFAGEIEPDEETEGTWKEVFSVLNTVCQFLIKANETSFREGSLLETNVGFLCVHRDQIKKMLQTWTSQSVSMSPSLRTKKLTVKQAELLRAAMSV